MVKLSKIFGLMVFFILALTFFIPKTNLYYLLESKLQNYNLVVSDEVIKESGFYLELKDAKIYFNSIQSAEVTKMELSTFLVYNSLDISGIKLSTLSKSFLPIDIKNINATYSIFNPLNLTVVSNGDFGVANGYINLLDKKISIKVKPSKMMLKRYKKTLKFLEKNQDGTYSYDTTFN